MNDLHFLITPPANVTYCWKAIENYKGQVVRWVTNDLSKVTCQECLAEAKRMGVSYEAAVTDNSDDSGNPVPAG